MYGKLLKNGKQRMGYCRRIKEQERLVDTLIPQITRNFGYQLFLTVNEPIEVEGEVKKGEIPSGFYAVLRSITISQMSESWPTLWKWLEESDYMHTEWVKGEYGWVDGF
jgi:hypothetical protein